MIKATIALSGFPAVAPRPNVNLASQSWQVLPLLREIAHAKGGFAEGKAQ
tara:strand:- start:94 stop:243 length:150 start_codon:yes stop_codon:yes gene_type:complete